MTLPNNETKKVSDSMEQVGNEDPVALWTRFHVQHYFNWNEVPENNTESSDDGSL